MSVDMSIVPSPERILVILPVSLPLIKTIVKPLPGLASRSKVAEFIVAVSLDGPLAQGLNQVEVVTNLALDLASIDQEQELRLYPGVKVPLQVPVLVTVYPDVSEAWLFGSQIFVVLLDLSAFRVPRG